jgi:hypothetical protein
MKITHYNTIPKFISFYINLNKKEEKEFTKLALCGYFSPKRSYKNILTELKRIKSGSGRVSSNLTVDLKKNTKMNKRALWNRLSELNGIAEKFLIIKNTEKDPLLAKSLLMEELSLRKDTKALQLHENPVKKMLAASMQDIDSLYRRHRLLQQLGELHTELDNYSIAAEYYLAQSDVSTIHYLTGSFKNLLDMELQKRNNMLQGYSLAHELLNSGKLDGLIDKIISGFPEYTAPLEIYYHLYNAFKNPHNEKHYLFAKNVFLKRSGVFSKEFRNEIFQYLRNFCIEKTNLGNSEFYNEIFELNELILEQGLYSGLSSMNSRTNHFRNFIFAASRLNKYEWIKEFIKKYSTEIPPDTREDEVNLSMAILNVYEKKFDAALEYLYRIKRKNYLHYLDTSVYKLIVFYEIAEYEESRMEMARLKDYLRQHKEIPSYFKNSYQRFLTKFALLLKLSENPEPLELGMFLNEMEKLKYIGLGGWLYEKGTELFYNPARK